MAQINLNISITEYICAGLACSISLFLIYVFFKVFKLVKPKKYIQIAKSDKKMLYVISLLILSMVFKMIEKLIKGYFYEN